MHQLTIPNQEIRNLFVKQIQKWFSDTTANDTQKLNEFCKAFPSGDAETITIMWFWSYNVEYVSKSEAQDEDALYELVGIYEDKED